MFERLKKYYVIGHSFYKQYPPNWLGQIRALLMFWALPPCRKILCPDPSGSCIHVASFAEADRVQKTLEEMGEKF